jgi:phosphoserine aminotransferase
MGQASENTPLRFGAGFRASLKDVPACFAGREFLRLHNPALGDNPICGTPFPNEGHLSGRIAVMAMNKPATRPENPRFSSGPCAKYPTFDLAALSDAPLGRSHRAAVGKARLKAAIEGTREVLGIPEEYRIGIVPASDTGAVEMALWNLLGQRKVEMLAWESFGAGWITDVVKQLKLDAIVKTADYGEIVDLGSVDCDNDVVFTWNGTTSGVRVPNGDWINPARAGLTICDATSAAFAQDLPWDKLDVTTFSWQKVLGGEAAHGMIVLSPRAVARLESYVPAWPLPKIFRLTKAGKLIEGIFTGATINTPSMLAVEDYLKALDWARSIGGLAGLQARADANFAVLQSFVAEHDWLSFLARDPATRSNTSVCLTFSDARIDDGPAFAKAVAKRLEDEGVAYDIGAYRDAPAGLRIWCGGTVEADDLAALMPWIEWAFNAELLQAVPV